MKKRIDEEMFIEIFKDVIRDNNDYGDKKKGRKHDAAVTKLEKMIKDVSSDKEYLTQIFSNLLSNEDPLLRRYVSSYCLRYNVLEDNAVITLNQLAKDYPNHKFFAELILKQHNKI